MTRRSWLGLEANKIASSLFLIFLGIATWVAYAYSASLVAYAAPANVDRIAYVDNDLNIQVVDDLGRQRIALTNDASPADGQFYIFPTWSPDSQRIAFIGRRNAWQAEESALYTIPATGGDRTMIYDSATLLPSYSYWSPDGQWLGFLTQNDTEMDFMLGHPDGKQETQKIAVGTSVYWAWSPNSQTVLMHVNGSGRDSQDAHLSIQDVQARNTPQTLTRAPSDFQSPQYSPDGKQILYAAIDRANQDALFIADAQDGSAKSIQTFNGRIAFSWSPDGKKIAWVTTDANVVYPTMGHVMISDADGSHVRALTTEDAMAFYWSPDGERLVYLTQGTVGQQACAGHCARTVGLSAPLPQQNQKMVLSWRVVDLTNNQVSILATFNPTQPFLFLMRYFDQYARSTTFWSPDGQKFVYTAEDADGNGTVWVADVTSQEQARKIGDGVLAVWSWN